MFERVEIGDSVLYRGDCREIMPQLDRATFAAVVTSPPYNQLSSIGPNPSGMWANTTGGAGFVRAVNENGYADDMNEAEYQADQIAVFSTLANVCTETASLFYNHQLRWRDGTCLHPVDWFKPSCWSLKQEIVWDRGGGMMMNARMFCRFDERILWFTRGQHHWNQASVGHGTIWRVARYQQQQGKEHPVAFPVEIPTRCIAATTQPGDTVLDPYMGSGTTGIASIRLGRRFVGIEREQRHFDVACRRIEEVNGKGSLFEAVL